MVKRFFFAATFAALMGLCSAHATSNITNLWYAPTSGGVVWDSTVDQEAGGLDSPEGWVSFNANQSAHNGTLGWTVGADSADDPTLRLDNFIDNDSAFSWLEYVVTVTMNKPFAFTNTPSVSLPSDWTINITQPVGPNISGNYVGVLDLLGGTPVDPGDTLAYTYKVTFSGSTSYSITESVNAVPVPEPATFSLLGLGSLFLGKRALARRRKR